MILFRTRQIWALFFVCTFFVLTPPIQRAQAARSLFVYTSIYKEYTGPLEKVFKAKHPDIDVQIFQAGSEKIQAKVEAELMAKRPQVDILLTSDPFWGYDLQRRGLSAHQGDPAKLTTNYNSLMVLIVNKSVPKDQRPASFSDLTKPQFKDLIQSGSPLESGSSFTAVAYLETKYGWDFFKKLRENDLASNGGNATVIEKVESGEKKVGIVLLENALASIKRGSPIEVIYPSDGSIPIPSVQVIMKDSANKEAAEKFSEFILSPEGQKILRSGYMYSVRNDVPAPDGARPFKEVTKNTLPWTPERIKRVADDSKIIKKQFNKTVLQ